MANKKNTNKTSDSEIIIDFKSRIKRKTRRKKRARVIKLKPS